MRFQRSVDRNKLEAWKVALLGGIAAAAIGWGLLIPVVQRSIYYDRYEIVFGMVVCALLSAWVHLDSKIERYDSDQDSPPMGSLLYWLPLIGVAYYFIRLRGLHAATPLITRAFLFSVLVVALFYAAWEFSRTTLNP